MYRISSLIAFLFIIQTLVSQVNQVDAKGRKQGPWQKLYPDGKVLQYKGQFKDDVPVGNFYYFYPGGEVRAVIENVPNTKRSYGTYYFVNREVMAFGAFYDQKKDSIWINYNNQGLIMSTEEFKNDKLNGARIVFYLDGQELEGKLNPYSIAFYKDDVLNGEYKELFSNGKLKLKGNYVDGNKEGEWIEYNLTGVVVGKVRYKNGQTHGWAYAYDSKGKQISQTMYRNGIILKGKDLEDFLARCKKTGMDPNQ